MSDEYKAGTRGMRQVKGKYKGYKARMNNLQWLQGRCKGYEVGMRQVKRV